MKLRSITLLLCGTLLFASSANGQTPSETEYSKLVGHTVHLVQSVSAVLERQFGPSVVALSNGDRYDVSDLKTEPASGTLAVVFTEIRDKENYEKVKGKIPDRLLYNYKMLIGDKVYYASPIK